MKNIISVQIVEHKDGINEDDKLMNYAVGHMMGGFDGIMQAHLLNEFEGAKTTFYVTYDDGSSEHITLDEYDANYDYLISLCD